MTYHKTAFRRKAAYAALLVMSFLLLAFLSFEDSRLHFFLHALWTSPEEQHRVWAFFQTYGDWIATIYVVFISCVLFLENKNPDRTVAWLVIMGALPIVGVFLYWVVGPNFRYLANKRRFRLPQPLQLDAHSEGVASSALTEGTASLVYHSSGAGVLAGCAAKILVDGKETFNAILGHIRGAKKHILVESYIVENDTIGNQVKDALIERARAGVPVCFIYDSVGSWRISSHYLRALRNAGVHVFAFLPVSFPMFRGANYRNHRKIIVIDGAIGFTGGLNIGDDYLGKNPAMGYWRDTHLEIRGPAVQALWHIAMKDMRFCGAPEHVAALFALDKALPCTLEDGSTSIQIVPSGPDTAWDTIQKMYFSLVSRARRRVWITTPYLIPGDALLEALCVAALSGVDVRLLLPGKADHPIVYWATLHPCGELLRAGVRIFFYDKTRFVHAKTLVCDGEIFSAGTANFDTRSLNINFEVQAVLYDEHLAQEGEEIFLLDLEHAAEVTLEDWEQRPFVQKIKENFGKLFSSLA